jgi:hypothetical protein
MAARIREDTTGTVTASIIISYAASTPDVAVWVVVIVVEEDGFGGGGSFEGCFCEFFIKFAGTLAPDAVGDEGNDEGKADQSDDAKNASYGGGIGKESFTAGRSICSAGGLRTIHARYEPRRGLGEYRRVCGACR